MGKLLKDSCESSHAKTWSAGSKFEQYSSVCVGKQDFWFFRLDAVNTKLVQENSVVISQFSFNLLEIWYEQARKT